MLAREQYLHKGHIQFLDNMGEGLIVCSNDIAKVKIFNEAAQNLLKI